MNPNIENLERVVSYLRQVPAWYLATSENNKPHVRPFSFAAVEDGKIWFVTGNNKDVYEELTANPYFELAAWHPGNPWVVVAGKAVFAEPSEAMRIEGFEHMLSIGEHHDSPNDGILVFFYVDEGRARVCEITGVEESFNL